MRTPLSKVRGLGSARHGTGEFIVQRVSAVALVVLLTLFIIVIVSLNGETHATVVATLSSPLVALIVLASVLVTTVHMVVGMRAVIEDYVPREDLKIAALIANWILSWAVALIAAFAILKIAFGGA